MDEKLRAKKVELLRLARETFEARYTPEQRTEIRSRAATKGAAKRKENREKKMREAVATKQPIASPPGTVERFEVPVPQNGNGEDAHGTRVVWNVLEMKAVACGAADILFKMGIGTMPDEDDRAGSSIIGDAIKAAQLDVIPRHRRRLHFSGRGVFNKYFWQFMKDRWNATRQERAVTDALKSSESGKQVAIVPAQEKPAAGPAPAQARAPAPASAPAPANSMEAMIDARIVAFTRPTEEFVLTEMSRMAKELEAMRELIGKTIASTTVYVAPAKIPTVAVVACEKFIFDHIVQGAKETGLNLNFRHYSQGSAPVDIVADWALVMKWGPHAWDDKLKASTIPNEQRAFVRGGTSQAIKQLEAWFKNE